MSDVSSESTKLRLNVIETKLEAISIKQNEIIRAHNSLTDSHNGLITCVQITLVLFLVREVIDVVRLSDFNFWKD
jgi:hypothetical protein